MEVDRIEVWARKTTGRDITTENTRIIDTGVMITIMATDITGRSDDETTTTMEKEVTGIEVTIEATISLERGMKRSLQTQWTRIQKRLNPKNRRAIESPG